MPRPDKPINSRPSLDGPVTSSRPTRWTKHGGPETVDGFRGAPSSVEVTVDDLTVITSDPAQVEQPSKWEQRGTSAHIAEPEDTVSPGSTQRRREWVSDRRIDGRTYRRTDALVIVGGPV